MKVDPRLDWGREILRRGGAPVNLGFLTAASRLQEAVLSPHVIVNADGTISHRCPFCGGCSHPSSGCEYGPGFVACYRCTLEGWEWIRRHVNGKGLRRGLPFYDFAGKR